MIGDGTSGNWEVFQFGAAEIAGTDTYDLTQRLRGQAGTDGATAMNWPVGSIFVLLDGTPAQIALASSARGVTQHFRYGPGSRPLGDPSYQYRTDAFSGAALRPYSVAHLREAVSGGDTDLTWIRRARKDGDGWDGDVPLSEAFERYAIRVFKDDVLKRQETINTATWRYTTAMKTFDGAGVTRVEVAQISDVYGEGPSASLILSD